MVSGGLPAALFPPPGRRPSAGGECDASRNKKQRGRERKLDARGVPAPPRLSVVSLNEVVISLFLLRHSWVGFPPFITKVLNTEGGEMLLYSGNGFMRLSLEMATGLWLKGAKPPSIETPLAEQVSVSQPADIHGASSCPGTVTVWEATWPPAHTQ